MMRSSVDLPQPDGPDQRDELALLDLEVDVLQRDRAALELLRDALDRDGASCDVLRRAAHDELLGGDDDEEEGMPSSAATMFVAQRFCGWKL